jgi:hypothetical protein
MKQFTNLRQMSEENVAIELYKEFQAAVSDGDASLSFEELLGGDVFIIETPEDLKEIHAYDSNGDLVNISSHTATFDSAHYFPSREWMLFFTATSDQGGPSFIVPTSLGKNYVTVEECILIAGAGLNNKIVRSFRGPLVEVTRVSPASGRINKMLLPFTQQQFDAHVNGLNVDAAMPQLTLDEAEFILTGITSEEWNLVYAEEE